MTAAVAGVAAEPGIQPIAINSQRISSIRKLCAKLAQAGKQTAVRQDAWQTVLMAAAWLADEEKA